MPVANRYKRNLSSAGLDQPAVRFEPRSNTVARYGNWPSPRPSLST